MATVVDGDRPHLFYQLYWPLVFMGIGLNISGNSSFLRGCIEEIKPDIIHFFCFQDAGYLVDEALLAGVGASPKLVGSCFGNDLYYFHQHPQHNARLRSILSKLDILITDNYRDLALAPLLGFSGRIVHVPLTSTLTKQQLLKNFQNQTDKGHTPCNERTEIIIKGGNIFRSNSTQFLRVLAQYVAPLKIEKINIIKPEISDEFEIARLEKLFPGKVVRHGFLPQAELGAMLSRSKLAISLNMSDGTPHFFFEACLFKAYPIFSKHTALQIYEDLGSFSLVDPDDPIEISKVLDALCNSDHTRVSHATALNEKLLDLLSEKIIMTKLSTIYQ